MNLSAAALTVVLLSILGLTACENSNSTSTNASPAPADASTKVAKSESDFQNEADDEHKIRADVRQATAQFVKANLPSWSLKGISTRAFESNIFWVAADIEKDKRNVVIELVVRKFFPESGAPYWKVVSLRKTLQEQLNDINDADVWKKLEEAQNQQGTPEP